MNKLFTKIVGAALGLTMAIGVGVAVGSNKEAILVRADSPVSIAWSSFGITGTAGQKTETTSGYSVQISSVSTQGVAKNGTIHNTVAFPGSITNLTVNGAATGSAKTDGTFEVFAGTSSSSITTSMGDVAGLSSTASNPSIDFTGDYSFFKIVVGSARTLKFTSLSISYTTGQTKTALDTPTNLIYNRSQNQVQWSSVDGNADHYAISYDNGANWVNATSTSYHSTSDRNVGSYTIKVKAVAPANSELYSDSLTASLTFAVTDHAGTQNDPYTVADAKAVIDSNTGLSDKYVTGIVSKIVTSWASNKISFDISSDGETSSQQFRFYGCVSSTEHPIASDDDVKEGATVVGFGTLTKYNSLYEYTTGCKIVAYTAPAPLTYHSLEYVVGEHGVYDGSTIKAFNVAEGKKHTVLAASDVGITAASGYSFIGWSDGTTTYQPDDEYTMGNSDVTLTALWEVYVDPSIYFTKITSTADISNGKYAIVYSDLMFDGSLTTLDVASNTKELTLQNLLTSYFTIDNGKILSASGYYIGKTANSNGLDSSTTEEYTNTISFDEEDNLVVLSSGGAYLRYNSASNQLRFRYYKSDSYTNQKAIQLYRVNFDKVFEDAITCTESAGTHVFNMGITWKANGTNLSLENLYNTLSTTNKSSLSAGTFAKYDYIVGKYLKGQGLTSYNDFMNRDPARIGAVRVGGLFDISSNSGSTATVIVVVSMMGLAAVGGYFFLRKRKEQ